VRYDLSRFVIGAGWLFSDEIKFQVRVAKTVRPGTRCKMFLMSEDADVLVSDKGH
jgi:hypothetical protein